jgi:CRISPR-associated protein Cas1
MTESEPLLRVMSLHALAYCERLFYLEEVEEIRIADKAVFDGRRVHEEMDEGEFTSFTLEAPGLGVKGKLDALRRKDGRLVPVERKKGKSAPGEGADAAWQTDQVQVGAYGLLLEEALGVTVSECRVRYGADNRNVVVPLGERLRAGSGPLPLVRVERGVEKPRHRLGSGAAHVPSLRRRSSTGGIQHGHTRPWSGTS